MRLVTSLNVFVVHMTSDVIATKVKYSALLGVRSRPADGDTCSRQLATTLRLVLYQYHSAVQSMADGMCHKSARMLYCVIKC